jgi:5-methylcytosine-specific restriction endonuclease McrA
MIKCEVCGKEMEYCGVGRKKKYCSDACAVKAGNHKRRSHVRICQYCGREYVKSIGNGGNKYCSNECKEAGLKAGRKVLYQEQMVNQYDTHEAKCKWCGKVFMTEYKQSHSFCSPECKHKWKNHYRTKIFRSMKSQHTIIDKDITLQKVINKYHGVCCICGEPIDKNDYWVDSNKVYRFGKRYPTIDHIIPRSKGGLHEWKNVQLAHMVCNASKGNCIGEGNR